MVRSRGLRGEIILDRPVEHRYAAGVRVQIGEAAYILQSLKLHQARGLLQVAGIASVEQAEALRGQLVSIARDAVPTAPGEYLLQDLIGCDVVDTESNHVYGMVSDWQSTGPQTLLEVDEGAEEPLLIPLVPAICVAVLPSERIIRVKLPEGLASLNAPGKTP